MSSVTKSVTSRNCYPNEENGMLVRAMASQKLTSQEPTQASASVMRKRIARSEGKDELSYALQFQRDQRTHCEQALVDSKDFAEAIVETVRQPLAVLDSELRIVSVNRAFA